MPKKRENKTERTNRRGVTKTKEVSQGSGGSRLVVKTKTKNGVVQKKKQKERTATVDSNGKTTGYVRKASIKSNPKKDARKKGNQDTRDKNSANRQQNRANKKKGATSSKPSTSNYGGMSM